MFGIRFALVPFALLAACVQPIVDVAGSSDESTTTATTSTTMGASVTIGSSSTPTSEPDTGNDVGPLETNPSTITSPTTSTTSDDSATSTTGIPTGECTDNLVVDGGFEAGTPSAAWTEQSIAFGTPVCDSSCTEDRGVGPYTGEWFVWLGGLADPEMAAVAQPVAIPGPTAFLGFWFDIGTAAGTGDDLFEVIVDDTVVFMLTDADIDAFDGYTPVSLDISDYADGGMHGIRFRGTFPGTGLSNFYLDEITLVSCEPDAGTSSTGGGSSSTGSSGTSG